MFACDIKKLEDKNLIKLLDQWIRDCLKNYFGLKVYNNTYFLDNIFFEFANGNIKLIQSDDLNIFYLIFYNKDIEVFRY